MKRTAQEAAETRAAILSAGLKVFAERGYERATLADIGARAGVTRGAVYHHFSDKAELYTTAIADRWATVGARVWAGLAGAGSARDRLRACLLEYFRAIEEDGDFRELLDVTILRSDASLEPGAGLADKQQGIREWVTQLSGLLADEDLRSGMSADDAAVLVVSTLAGVMVTWRMGDDLFSPARKGAVLTDALLSALFG
ncbi:TetR family transcriptional regulator [Actinoplanes sichuanensis]|uniref:TetR/AcrR family transcriptional regulator n=1 Tax=Actinoplanes sichuanensis TaxID=512349 RepID=A0ABW4A0X0_9ACTN|nr:TetR family transcriptional regulator [Actinoplanes sichuanensis]BEL01872.1 TetR family transcriptional regulator [Actinoplanes sichuanensis]